MWSKKGFCLIALAMLMASAAEAFQPLALLDNKSTKTRRQLIGSTPTTATRRFSTNARLHRPTTELYFFGRGNKKDEEKEEEEKVGKTVNTNNNDNTDDTKDSSPFFARMARKVLGNDNNKENQVKTTTEEEQSNTNIAAAEPVKATAEEEVVVEEPKPADDEVVEVKPTEVSTPVVVAAAAAAAAAATTTTTPPKKVVMEELSPAARAAKLRADAEKARLEAERMDAELTLRKIARLERELENARKHPERNNGSTNAADNTEQLQREMDALQAKIRGETTTKTTTPLRPPRTVETTKSTTDRSSSTSSSMTSTMTVPKSSSVGTSTEGPLYEGKLGQIVQPFSQESLDETISFVEAAPEFLRKTMAMQVEMDFRDGINTTELALKMDKMNRLDFSYSSRSKPKFTAEEIEKRKKELVDAENSSNNVWAMEIMHPLIKKERETGIAKDNATELALLVLEYEYYMQDYTSKPLSMEQIDMLTEGEEWMKPIISALNTSAVDSTIDTLYPKCTRKGNEPTEAQVQRLVSEVLPKVSFSTNSKPEQVLGGYIIRGTTKLSGDEFIEKIDNLLEKSNLLDKMTVLYTNDFTVFSDNPDDVDLDALEPILYVTGPEIVRDSKPIQLSTVSAFGVATSWYLSLYPFLLNPTLAARVDEQLALADANMNPDLSWLTDLSIPLFTTFVGIQLVHELAHLVAAGANNIKTSAPTFVPSIITGITSSVTTFREPPKNKNAMFDFSISGPLAGMIASLAAITLGAQLTVVSDPSSFPALPLEILRQSTLGGGIINGILGNGALSVPEGAIGTPAVAGMTVPLHPVAIAGYISLVVNALSLLPIGNTDGGRVGLTLFGRGAKLLVGNLFLLAILFVGLIGSDLFLFYFAFCIAFQAGNEIPSRNEVDKLDLPRIFFATGVYVLAALSLIPFQ